MGPGDGNWVATFEFVPAKSVWGKGYSHCAHIGFPKMPNSRGTVYFCPCIEHWQPPKKPCFCRHSAPQDGKGQVTICDFVPVVSFGEPLEAKSYVTALPSFGPFGGRSEVGISHFFPC